MLVSDCRLCDVAQACGFADQSHLSRTFHRFVGTAPNAWRRARFVPWAQLSVEPDVTGEPGCGS